MSERSDEDVGSPGALHDVRPADGEASATAEPGSVRTAWGALAGAFADFLAALARAGRTRVAVATEPVREAAAHKREQLEDVIARTERFVRERPLASLGIAVLAGWLLFGRRR